MNTHGVHTPLVTLPHLQRVSLALALRGGPRYEPPGSGGLTHAVEHLIFRGAGPYPTASALFAACEPLGEEPEARTLDDALVISWDVEPSEVERAVEILCQVALHPHYDGFANEVELIREELLEQLDERGRLTSSADLLRELTFGEHPLGRTILGSETQLRQLDERVVDAWRAQLVQRENLVLAAAGPLTPEAWARATAPLAALPNGPRLREPAPPPELGKTARFQTVDGSAQVELGFAFRGPGANDPRHAVCEVLLDLLDGGPCGALGEALVDSGLCYDAAAELTSFPRVSLLEVELSVERPKLALAIETTLRTLAKLGERATAQTLQRVHAIATRRARWLRDDSTSLADDLALRALRGRPLDPTANLNARAAVDSAALRELAQELFDPARRVSLVLGAPSPAQRKAARRALAQTW